MKTFVYTVGGVLVAVFIVGAVLANAAGSDSNSRNAPSSGITIYVTGSAGEFSGSIASGGSSRSVDGTTPATFSAAGGSVAVSMQKRAEAGRLHVMIEGCRNGGRPENVTTAAYGVVTISC